jgi:hypothetical protein
MFIPENPPNIGFRSAAAHRPHGRLSHFDYLIDIGTMENYQKAQATWPGFPQA